MYLIMQHSIRRHLPLSLFAKRATSIQVAIIAWEIAACHFYTQAMSSLKHLRRRPQVYLKRIDLSGHHQLGLLQRIAKPGAQDTIANGHRAAIRPDIT